MADDSFRGTCINCGTPTPVGAPCRNCQAALENKAKGDTRQYYRADYFTPTTNSASIPFTDYPTYKKPTKEIDDMNGVQVCERCGSIGRAREFVSVSANTMDGSALHMPELISMAQLEKMQEDDAELAYQSNYVLCRNCRTTLTSFLHNQPTDSGQAGPIAPRLPKPTQPSPSGEQTFSQSTNSGDTPAGQQKISTDQ